MPLPTKKSQASKPVETSTSEPSQDFITIDQVGAKLKELEDYAMTFRGKPDCNPYIWRAQFLEPLMKQVKTEPSQELFKRIMDIPCVKPTVE